MAKTVALRFVDALNRHDIERLRSLMAKGHRLVAASGQIVRGRKAVQEVWLAQWKNIPNYRIHITDAFADGSVVGLFGSASGHIEGELTRGFIVPAAWRAKIKRGRVSEWQIYASQKPVLEAMNRGDEGVALAQDASTED